MDANALLYARRRFEAIIGTGGIGTGTFFALEGNHPLGREESRAGRFLDRLDYCKLHIVTHCLKTLLGGTFQAFPIGRVGEDAHGAQLLGEMRDAGLNLKYVRALPGYPTLYSFCYVFPDGAGGNLTTADSACSQVTAETIATAEVEFANYAESALALALPEVPLDARVAVLDYGTRYNCLRIASFTSAEMPEALARGLIQHLDLLAINLDEAQAVIGGAATQRDGHEIAKAAAWKLRFLNRKLAVIITGGAEGAWLWDGQELIYECAWSVTPVSTAGAGDAVLAGVLAAVATSQGLDVALRLGNLCGALAVTSPHTIHPEFGRRALRDLAGQATRQLDRPLWELLGGFAKPGTVDPLAETSEFVPPSRPTPARASVPPPLDDDLQLK
jgi:sugar/nucleoside kinase (ribokinase family)